MCLIIIALKPNNFQVSSPRPNINVSAGEQIIQLAPNRIAVLDNNINSGMRGTILIFDYDSNTKNFNLMGSMNYTDYFSNPSKHGLPAN